MPATTTKHLEPLTAIVGRWRTSGTVLDDRGNATTEISGTDVYEVLPGGHWIAHDVDVRMGEDHTLAHELIGGVHPDGGWQMHAFDHAAGPTVMRLSREEPDLLLLHGGSVRSWFSVRAGAGRMSTLWEREVDGQWVRWMDMRFERM